MVACWTVICLLGTRSFRTFDWTEFGFCQLSARPGQELSYGWFWKQNCSGLNVLKIELEITIVCSLKICTFQSRNVPSDIGIHIIIRQ